TARRTRTLADDGPMPPIAARPAASRSAAAAVLEPPTRIAPGARMDQHLVAALAPQSPAAEQYRSLRARIARAENGRAIRAIVVTSPAKGDGKSLTAANLALTMAQEFQ